MKTTIVKLDPRHPDPERLREVAGQLLHGKIVAFPTETVYGLGANALDVNAVKKIFIAKGRPADNPLIIHIANKKDVINFATKIPKGAKKLIHKFWPGPLTIILKKSEIVPHIVTANLDTAAIRMPAHKIALALIKEAKVSIAAPSANRSGKPSPTSAKHVIHDLYGKIDAIIDGGETKTGIESTILDLTTNSPILLRPGGVNLEELRKVLGKIKIHPLVKEKKIKKIIATSPGMIHTHYAPDAKLIVIKGKYKKAKQKIQQLANKYKKEGKVIGVMTSDEKHNYQADLIKFVGKDFDTIAKNLFKTFREFDEDKIDVILAEGVSDQGKGLAIMNRLRKAAHKVIKV